MAAFTGGVLLASSLDWPAASFAQAGRALGTTSGPRDDGGAPGFADVAEKVVPAVVSIEVEQDPGKPDPRQRGRMQVPPGMEEFFRQFEGQMPQQQRPREGSGSGFLISPDGYILTNNHVVADADRMNVTLTDHRTFRAKLIGRDPTTDVAVIKIEGKGFPTLAFGNDEAARIGNWVIAVGNPLGLDFTVTAGIISAKGRGMSRLLESRYAITDFIQTDAAINPGNSGGPLLNARGEVIGINSAIASQTGFYSGYGFAIPITLAKQVADDLIKYGRVRRAVLGIQIGEVTPEDAKAAGLDRIMGVKVGALTADGVSGSPAKDAGLEVGDIIVKVDGRETDRVSTLQRIVRGKKPGETVAVEVARFGERKSYRVKLAEAPNEAAAPVTASRDALPAPDEKVDVMSSDKLGITVAPLSAAQAERASVPATQRGLRVTEVAASSGNRDKFDAGFDVITEIVYPRPRRPVRNVDDLQAALRPLRGGDVLSVTVYNLREKDSRLVTLRVGE